MDRGLMAILVSQDALRPMRALAEAIRSFGRFHLGTETEAAKYRRRVPSASRELAIARLGRFELCT